MARCYNIRWSLLFWGLLALAPYGLGSERQESAQLLRHRLELAAGSLPYILVTPKSAAIYVKGIPVKRLPIREATGLGHGKSRASRVETVVPVTQVRKIVLRPDEPGFDSTRFSPHEAVSVDDMPEAFLVELKDGSFFYVRSGAWHGTTYWLREKVLQLRLTWSYLGAILKGNLSASLIQLEMEDSWARRLFWTLQKESGVIY